MSFRFASTIRGMALGATLALSLSPRALHAQSTAQKFPYPGDKQETQPDTKDAPATKTPQPSTTQKFPYPGDNPNQGMPADDTPPPTKQTPEPAGTPETPQFPGSLPRYQRNPDPPSASDSTDSSSSSSSAAPGDPALPPDALKDEGSSAEDAVKPTHHTRKLPKPAPEETPQSRADKDLSVAEFYMNDQNYTAAYARAKDATSVQPEDPYAHFALAEAARKLGKLDEARAEYQQVLKLDPIPKQAKASKAALAEMEGRR